MFNNNQFYISFAKAHKEPNRTDFENGSPVPEALDDLEFGWRWKTADAFLNAKSNPDKFKAIIKEKLDAVLL